MHAQVLVVDDHHHRYTTTKRSDAIFISTRQILMRFPNFYPGDFVLISLPRTSSASGRSQREKKKEKKREETAKCDTRFLSARLNIDSDEGRRGSGS